MYGMIPNANMDAWAKAPPVKRFNRPKRPSGPPLASLAAAKTPASIPGSGT